MLRAFPKQHKSEFNNSRELIQVTYQKLVSPSLTEVEAVAGLGGLVIKYKSDEFKVTERWILKVPITPIGLLSSPSPQPVAHGNPLGSPISLDAYGTLFLRHIQRPQHGLTSNGPTTIFLTMTPSTAEVWRIQMTCSLRDVRFVAEPSSNILMNSIHQVAE
ncbi:hypothetical protein EV702DRAFT_1071021 [Suillus placidus]|uniref:Uncharacterized protein n=1 Tax=Suillus placidus TaxID=48579 RepID=A0A9P7A4C2_9AGAM|nr:hypothetical protein EV702DRAFT_1071021 [Suillus placidus]